MTDANRAYDQHIDSATEPTAPTAPVAESVAGEALTPAQEAEQARANSVDEQAEALDRAQERTQAEDSD